MTDGSLAVIRQGHVAIPEQVIPRLFKQIEAVLSATDPNMMLLQRERVLGMLAAVALTSGITTGEEERFSFDLDLRTVGPPVNPDGAEQATLPNRAARRAKRVK